MVRLTERRRAVPAEKCGDLANFAVAVLVFRQAVGQDSFSLGVGLAGFAVSYSIPVFRSARPWVKLELYNVFNNDTLVTWNTTVRADPASPRDDLGLPTGYIKGPQFGRAQGNGNYLPPRSFQMAFGVRF